MTDATAATLRRVSPPDRPADLLITGASVRTLDRAGTVADALAVTGGKIAAVGAADAALPAFTSGGAWVDRLDGEAGSLEPGMLADLVVLDRDLNDRGASQIGDAHVLLTMVEGDAVHVDPALAS
jgi:predicted amidohydrolase YtcJ